MDRGLPTNARASWRDRWNEIIFRHDTFAGRLFDIILLVLILLNLLIVILDSVPDIRQNYGMPLGILEWIFTGLFTLEYVARLATAANAGEYARSFFGVVDLLAVGPIYLGLLFGTSRSFTVLRALRLLRVFRILKLAQFVGEATALRAAVLASSRKIVVFLFAVLTVVIIAGALMYEIEGDRNGFTSIPTGMYWAIVTVTTVGYGDISPHTIFGRSLASILMILGYGVIAVPTGIVSYELRRGSEPMRRRCVSCGLSNHDKDADYCKKCGVQLRTPLEGTAEAE